MIEKIKNNIIVNVKINAFYRIDLNTGIVYGLDGEPMKRPSTLLKNYIMEKDNWVNPDTYVGCFIRENSYHLSNLQSMVDTLKTREQLDNVGFEYEPIFVDMILNTYSLSELTKTRFLLNTASLKQVYDYLENKKTENIRKEYNIDNEVPYEYIKSHRDKLDFINESYYIDYIYDNNIPTNYYYRINISNYERLLKDNNKEKYSFSKDFLKDYYCNLKYYILNKDAIIENRLSKLANELKSFGFNYGDYVVLIPQSRQDFLNESNKMHNCVYRSYMEMHSKGDTIIVFIRKANDINTPYITCEIDPHTLQVSQALRENNKSCDANDKLFISVYNQYLEKLMSK